MSKHDCPVCGEPMVFVGSVTGDHREPEHWEPYYQCADCKGNQIRTLTADRDRLQRDIEEFHEIVERHGCYKADLEHFAKIIQPSLFEAA
jgi:hypothetical protein